MIPEIKIKENLRVLLVEDNLLNQRLLNINLAKLNCIVTVANNGLEGVESFKKQKFDVILMDLMMPVMDGYEATMLIRQLKTNRHTPLIALTASIMPDEMQKCLKVGFSDSISKPIIRDNLYRILDKWLKIE